MGQGSAKAALPSDPKPPVPAQLSDHPVPAVQRCFELHVRQVEAPASIVTVGPIGGDRQVAGGTLESPLPITDRADRHPERDLGAVPVAADQGEGGAAQAATPYRICTATRGRRDVSRTWRTSSTVLVQHETCWIVVSRDGIEPPTRG